MTVLSHKLRNHPMDARVNTKNALHKVPWHPKLWLLDLLIVKEYFQFGSFLFMEYQIIPISPGPISLIKDVIFNNPDRRWL